MSVETTYRRVDASEMLTAYEDFPVDNYGQSKSPILMAKMRSVYGKFSKSSAVILLCYSRQLSWYVFSLVSFYFMVVKQLCTLSTPFGPPKSRPGSLKTLHRLSRSSTGMTKKTPVKVKSKMLVSFEKQP